MDKKPEQAPRKKRTPRKISSRYLENAALYYLQRYATSVENLRRVLTRKVNKSCAFHETPPEPFYPEIEALLQRYIATGLLNDKTYAEGRVSSLRRQGRSRQAIAAKLQVKGLARDDIDAALETVDTETEADNDAGHDAEFTAALKLAKKRKIGPYRTKPLPDDRLLQRKQQQREMAVLARGGFSFDIAQRALAYDLEEYED